MVGAKVRHARKKCIFLNQVMRAFLSVGAKVGQLCMKGE